MLPLNVPWRSSSAKRLTERNFWSVHKRRSIQVNYGRYTIGPTIGGSLHSPSLLAIGAHRKEVEQSPNHHQNRSVVHWFSSQIPKEDAVGKNSTAVSNDLIVNETPAVPPSYRSGNSPLSSSVATATGTKSPSSIKPIISHAITKKTNKKKNHKSSKSSSSKRKRWTLPGTFFQLQHLHDRKVIEDLYETLARQSEINHIKWIHQLQGLLDNHHHQQQQQETSLPQTGMDNVDMNNDLDSKDHQQQHREDNGDLLRGNNKNKKKNQGGKARTTLLTTCQDFMSRKSIPSFVKERFWDAIVAKPTLITTTTEAAAAPPPTTTTTTTFTSPPYLTSTNHWKTVSTKERNQHVQLLMTAREFAVQSPLIWSPTGKRKLRQRYNHQIQNTGSTRKWTMTTFTEQRRKIIANLHAKKSQDELQQEAQTAIDLLIHQLPPKYYQGLLQVFQEYVDSYTIETESSQVDNDDNDDNDNDDDNDDNDDETNGTAIAISKGSSPDVLMAKPKRMRLLFPHLYKQTQSHVHLIASELADYFYIHVPADKVEIVPQEEDHQQEEQEDDSESKRIPTTTATATTDHPPSSSRDIAENDPRVVASRKAWKESKQAFVDAFQAIHGRLLQEQEQEQEQKRKIEEQELASRDEADEADDNDDNDNDNDNDGDDSMSAEEKAVRSMEQVAADHKADMKKGSQFMSSRMSRIVMEAIPMNTITASAEEPFETLDSSKMNERDRLVWPLQAPNDRMVFVDNLPIDMTDDRLREVYSRCGDIEWVKVFHRRPELDPGRLSIHSRKLIRPPSTVRSRWVRPRTPLYAAILFTESMGYDNATCDPLRIFGMVVDKHLMRSHRAKDLTTLYLEDIPLDEDVSSMEYRLSEILSPDLYVYSETFQQRPGRPMGKFGRTHCEIHFPHFEAAYWAYFKLWNELEFLQPKETTTATTGDANHDEVVVKCELHWMATPKDAIKYWTRQLNF